jgi:hypothetical protein
MKTSMFIRVCAFLMIGAGVVFAANGATVTWTGGAGDGLWLTAGNWDTGSVPASTDEVIIPASSEAITITYVAGSDFTIASGGSVTIGENVTWVQSGGNSWWNIQGVLTLEKGAQMQIGTCSGTKFGSTAVVTLKEGSLIQVKRANGGKWDEVGTWKVDGTVYSTDTLTPNPTEIQTIMAHLNMGEKGMLAGIKEVQWSGEAELSIDGTLSFGGFTAQKAGTSEANNGVTLKKGTYIFQKNAGTAMAGIVTYLPSGSAEGTTWVDVPSGAKVELVFADSSITAANVFEKINAYSRQGVTAANVIRRDGVTFASEAAFKKAFTISGGADGVYVWPKRGSFCIRIK